MEDLHGGEIVERMQDGHVIGVKHVNHFLVKEFIFDLLWNVFIVLVVWNRGSFFSDDATMPFNLPVGLMCTIGSGPDSVVNGGDLLVILGRNHANINVNDIVVVKDKRIETQLYTQKVTDLYTPIGHTPGYSTANTLVQINYQRKHSDPLKKKWFDKKDVVGKVVFVLPYGGMVHYVAYNYPLCVLIAAMLYIEADTFKSLIQDMEFGPGTLMKVAIFAAVFLYQPTLVT